MTTPIWVPLVAAALGALATLGVQWLNSRWTYRLAEAERGERRYQERKGSYIRFLVAARALQPALESNPDVGGLDLGPLREAAADIEVNMPELADGGLARVIATAERLHGLVLTNRATAPVVKEAKEEFSEALNEFRDLIWADLGTRGH